MSRLPVQWLSRGAGAAMACVVLAACASLPATVAGELRVLSYNIHAGKDASGEDNLLRVSELVEESAADIVLLQEVDRGTTRSGVVDQLVVLERLTGYHGAFGKSLDYQGGQYGIAVLSRWPITSDSTVPLPVDPPQERSGGAHEPRVALVAHVAAPAGRVTIVNTHIDASRDDRWRLQESRTLVALAAALYRSDTTAILLVGGDINSEPGSAVQQLITGSGLRDAWAECGDGAGLTYPADSAVKRIDYVYLTGRSRCTTADVQTSRASDHRPLLVRVALPMGH